MPDRRRQADRSRGAAKDGRHEILFDGPAGWWAVANPHPATSNWGRRRPAPPSVAGPSSAKALELVRRNTQRTLVAIDTLLTHVQRTPAVLRRPHRDGRQDLKIARRMLAYYIGPSDDIIYRPFHYGTLRGLVVYADGVVDPRLVSAAVLGPLQRLAVALAGRPQPEMSREAVQQLRRSITIATETRRTRSYRAAAQAVVEGKAVLVVAGVTEMLTFGAEGWPKRQPDAPESERTIRGPREGLVETLSDNLAMIRRWIRDPSLRVRKFKVGKLTRTPVAMLYIEGVAPPALVDEAWERLQRIDLDAVIESAPVEEYLAGRRGTLFPLVQATERTDKLASALLEGRVVVLVDRSPFGLFLPTSITELYQSPDDFYVNFWQGTAVRLLRILGLFISLALPALYITLVGFHPELVPTKLALAIAGIRQGTPMPAAVELLVMEILFELFREGGLRLPAAVGQTVGIAGGVVLGTAAAQAGFVSGIVIVVTAGTAIASFAIPNYFLGLTWRILKFGLIALSAMFGLTGLIAGLLLIAVHLTALESGGVPYTTPLGPVRPRRMGQIAVRPPHWERGSVSRPRSS